MKPSPVEVCFSCPAPPDERKQAARELLAWYRAVLLDMRARDAKERSCHSHAR